MVFPRLSLPWAVMAYEPIFCGVKLNTASPLASVFALRSGRSVISSLYVGYFLSGS
ncbi:MAG: hypothetical protein ACD_38C00129G0002 [uncultured bacterium]|nr:MAG: hypothetical protein ACD_38C00129G0002 [uncultured bacterium]